MAKNKVVFGNQTLIDITDTTASTSTVMSGEVFYGADGERYVGELEAGGVIISDTTDSHGGTIREITTIGDPVMLQEKTVTPSTSTQIVTPDRYGDLVESEITLSGNARFSKTATTSHTWQMISGESYIVIGHGTINAVPVTISDEIVWSPPVSLEFSPTGSSSWPGTAYLESVVLTSTGATITYSASADNYGSIVIDNIYEAGGYHGLNQVTVNPIPSQYIVPSGTSQITENGSYDITSYSAVNVDVPAPVKTYTATISGSGSTSGSAMAYVTFNNITYYQAGSTFQFKEGDTIQIVVNGSVNLGNIYVNDTLVYTGTYYDYTAPDDNININLTTGSTSTVRINTSIIPVGTLSIASNGVYNVRSYNSVNVGVAGGDDLDALISRTLTSFSNSTITTIGQYAFAGCTSLRSVDFQNAVSINQCAFMYAGLSGSLSFPAAVSIGPSAFAYCKFSSIYFPNVQMISSSAFYYCSSLTTASFPVATKVSTAAFGSCIKLSSVSFPELSAIEASAFMGCSSLSYAEFPKVSFIGASAFQRTGLTSINIPSITNIEQNAFANCYSLSEIGASLSMSNLGNSAFMYCSNLESVNFPNLTNFTGDQTFNGCSKLSSVSFPNLSGTALAGGIGIFAFNNCTSLIRVDASKCGRIGASAFSGCSSLKYLNTPSVQYIGSYALAGTAIESASFPLLASCYIYAFSACGNLSYVNFPILSQILSYTFANCSQLQTVYLPSVSIVYQDAFSNCSMLSSINLPEVKTMYTRAFAGCSQLSLAIMPMASSFYSSAFFMCTRLMSLYLLGSSVCKLGNVNVFTSTPISTYTTDTGGVRGSIYVPASLYSTYIASTNWTTYSARFVSLTDAEIEALPF